ncbi:MAG: NADH-quinone oxidoreductase subunit NuoN [Proteobacteria bacterium]|nr:NADH-quinone oxidoreductase subunit NuoN [Pseudomonadota bacterium]MBS0572602.1 NADH-quinone oxidoreductase subunit NuoN [Pseudomonadota bacterium]
MEQVDFAIVLPEVLLAVYAMAALMLAVYTTKDGMTRLLTWATVGLFLAVAVWIGLCPASREGAAFGGAVKVDAFARFAKVTVLVGAAAVLAMSEDWMRRQNLARFEFPVLITFSVIGMMVMVSAGDLMTLYLGLELQSLSLYVIAAMRRDSGRSTEAGLKYFVLGALASGLLLYGASLTYGFTGTTLFSGIIASVQSGHVPTGALFGLVFLIAGLAFKVSAVPFHMWTPDVYEGSPTQVTAYFATAPKVAAMALFARLMFDGFGDAIPDWSQVVALLSVLSMFLGAVGGIGQREFKRLMAYSSISHMGFALVGLAAGTAVGVQAMLTYMAIYVVMNVGTFAFILAMEKDGKHVTDLADLNQIARREPGKALALLILMFSLAGVPPTLGFFAKFTVLKAAVDAGMNWLAVLGVIASVIGAFYYLRVVYYMYFGAEREGLTLRAGAVQWAILAGSALVMILGVVNLLGMEGAAALAAEALVR